MICASAVIVSPFEYKPANKKNSYNHPRKNKKKHLPIDWFQEEQAIDQRAS